MRCPSPMTDIKIQRIKDEIAEVGVDVFCARRLHSNEHFPDKLLKRLSITPTRTLRNLSRSPIVRGNWTPLYQQILELMAEGYGNKGIAIKLGRNEDTLKTHIKRMLSFLDADNRTHAVSIGYQRGYLKVKEEE